MSKTTLAGSFSGEARLATINLRSEASPASRPRTLSSSTMAPARVRVQHPHVRVEPEVLGGSPHIVGTRIPVRRLWAWHQGGTTIETLLKRYPQLGPARVLDALAFAYDNQELVEEDLAHEQALLAQSTAPRPLGLRPMAQQALPLDETQSPRPGQARARRA